MITKFEAIRSLVGGAITQTASGRIIYHDGQIPPTEKEIQAKIAELEAAEPMRVLRIERNRRLTETDWVTLKAYSQGEEVIMLPEQEVLIITIQVVVIVAKVVIKIELLH